MKKSLLIAVLVLLCGIVHSNQHKLPTFDTNLTLSKTVNNPTPNVGDTHLR